MDFLYFYISKTKNFIETNYNKENESAFLEYFIWISSIRVYFWLICFGSNFAWKYKISQFDHELYFSVKIDFEI